MNLVRAEAAGQLTESYFDNNNWFQLLKCEYLPFFALCIVSSTCLVLGDCSDKTSNLGMPPQVSKTL